MPQLTWDDKLHFLFFRPQSTQTSWRQALRKTMDCKPRVIYCSVERNQYRCGLFKNTASSSKYRPTSTRMQPAIKVKSWSAITHQRWRADCQSQYYSERLTSLWWWLLPMKRRQLHLTEEAVGGATSQSVLFTFGQIKPHEYKITRKITLKTKLRRDAINKTTLWYDHNNCI